MTKYDTIIEKGGKIMKNIETIYTVKQVAEMLQLNEVTIRRYIEIGKLKAIKFGKVWRIKQDDLEAFIGEGE